MRNTSSWRCKCGIRLKVLTTLDPSKPTDQLPVKCPHCGDQQTVYGYEVISIETEMVNDQKAT